MEMLERFEPLALLLAVIGALNWGIVGLFDTNVLSEVLGTGTLLDVVYVVIGVSALMLVPRLLEGMHLGHGHGPHPRGA
jgi:uncharacterized membrane protein YuzA (DUF378 family)